MQPQRKATLALGAALAIAVSGICVHAKAFSPFWGLGELTRLTVFEGAAGVLAQTAEMLASIKEQTTILKTAYKGIDSLTHGGWNQLSEEMWRGLSRNPEVASLYRDIRDIEDLRYTNAQAERTLNNMLFAHVFGPVVDYIHGQANDMNALTTAAETRERHAMLLRGERTIVDNLHRSCDTGPGGCSTAADRASIEQLSVLSDLHELAQRSLELQERAVERNGEDERAQFYARSKLAEDYFEYAGAIYGIDTRGYCPAGECIAKTYSGARNAMLSKAKSRVRQRQHDAISRLYSGHPQQ